MWSPANAKKWLNQLDAGRRPKALIAKLLAKRAGGIIPAQNFCKCSQTPPGENMWNTKMPDGAPTFLVF
jgi:hypothetical protein|tara:strand:- start:293 stop:499 length:207 start_codon:yes stop_codon:yes gene_type:complete